MKEKKKISVLVVPVNREPEVRLIDDELDDLQQIVGGSICGRAIAPHLSLYANDNGLRLRLPYNRCGYVGNFLIQKISSAGNGISLTGKDIATAKEWLTRNDHRPPLCHICGNRGGATMFCPCGDVLMFCCDCYNRLEDVLNSEDKALHKRWCLCPRCRPLPEFNEGSDGGRTITVVLGADEATAAGCKNPGHECLDSSDSF